MKIILRTYIILSLSLFAVLGYAQTSKGSGSRLQLGQKTNASKLQVKRVPYLLNPQSSDRSIQLRPSQAFNAYYRAVLFGNPNSTTLKESASAKASAPSNEVASDIKNNIEIIKTEDKFFANDKIIVYDAYPNPANDVAEINYHVLGQLNDAKIVIYNILGTNAGEYSLDKNSKIVHLQTQEIPTGIYYYQLLLDGKKVAAKKLLIRH